MRKGKPKYYVNPLIDTNTSEKPKRFHKARLGAEKALLLRTRFREKS